MKGCQEHLFQSELTRKKPVEWTWTVKSTSQEFGRVLLFECLFFHSYDTHRHTHLSTQMELCRKQVNWLIYGSYFNSSKWPTLVKSRYWVKWCRGFFLLQIAYILLIYLMSSLCICSEKRLFWLIVYLLVESVTFSYIQQDSMGKQIERWR